MSRQQAPARRIEQAERRAQALELRKAGATYEQIGAKLGITNQAAHRLVSRGLAALGKEAAEDVLALELSRLDGLLMAMWPQARRGNHGAVDRVLRIMERRARLLGLDHNELRAGVDASGAIVVQLTWPRPDPENQPAPIVLDPPALDPVPS